MIRRSERPCCTVRPHVFRVTPRFDLEAVTLALDLDDMAVVEQAVEHGGGQNAIAGEGLVPRPEAEVGGHDGRGLFIAGGDDLEEQMGLLALQREVADLGDDQQAVAAQGSEGVGQPPVSLRLLDFQDQIGGGGELGLDPGIGCLVADGDGQVGLADAGWAEENRVLLARDEGERGQLLDLALRRGAGELEVVFLQRLDHREPGHAHQGGGRSGAAEVALGQQHILQEVGKTLPLVAGGAGQRGIAVGDPGQLEFFAELDQAVVGQRAHASLPIAS